MLNRDKKTTILLLSNIDQFPYDIKNIIFFKKWKGSK